MRSPAIVPALALVAGAAIGAHGWFAWPAWRLVAIAAVIATALLVSRRTRAGGRTGTLVAACLFLPVAVLLGQRARDDALHTTLRRRLDEAFGGFAIESIGPAGAHPALLLRLRLREDAAVEEGYVALRGTAQAVRLPGGAWTAVAGGVTLSVNGAPDASRVGTWRAGRALEAPVVFRRPARYLNDGVPDFEAGLALAGTTLFGTVKSGLLVEVRARGSAIDERMADARAFVRRAIRTWVSPHDPVSGAIVTAILIGDRTGLPDDVRDRLQKAGTYHVIAISGGNIAILAVLVCGTLALVSFHDRAASLVAIAGLVAYAALVTAGPSVWRATVMAVVYLGARVLDHRTAPAHTLAVAAALMTAARPLDVLDAGFVLTFGATLALLAVARLGSAHLPRGHLAGWVAASLVASVAVEVVLLPASAVLFSRITGAGVLLNLVAVPVMALVQVAGMLVVACAWSPPVAATAGWVASAGATLLVDSARLVDVVPWLVRRVPSPAFALVAVHYVALVALLRARGRWRVVAGATYVVAAVAIVTGVPLTGRQAAGAGRLRLTMWDVGQGESMLLEPPDGPAMLVDAGGMPFGDGAFDVGGRVLAPALWARGLRRLGILLVTHGDPDHLGGATAVFDDFRPARVWGGVTVAGHRPTQAFLARVHAAGVRDEARRVGQTEHLGGARVRVLNPPEPDWERPRVRNDDSVVLEVVYGGVAMLLTGDIGEEVERAIVPQLTPAPIRILKVAHHGSRTSSSTALLEGWRPQIALVSAGRGNTFGHPAPDTLARLAAIGARVYRTDRDGEITVTTDGAQVDVGTFAGTSP